MPKRVLVCLLSALAVSVAAADLNTRIQRVEQGLRPLNASPVAWNLAERMKFYKVPGVSIAVINGGKIEWARGYGVVSEGGKAVDSETLFQAASISKPVASMAALRLVEQGKLSLDDDVNLKLRSWKVPESEFTKQEKVTLRRLLNHSAGLTVHGFPGYASDVAVPSLQQVLDGKPPANTAAIRVDVTPGTLWRYSGGGYEVMQQTVEDVTGKPFPEVMQTLVLGPAGMKRSTYKQPLPAGLADNAAAAHRSDGTMIPGRWHTYPEQAAAGLWTTPSDLARFAMAIQQGRILKPAARTEMLTKVKGDYGLGLGLRETGGHKSFAHGGSNAGFQCMLFAYLDDGSGVVVMTNGDQGGKLLDEILRSVSAEYGWADFKVK